MRPWKRILIFQRFKYVTQPLNSKWLFFSTRTKRNDLADVFIMHSLAKHLIYTYSSVTGYNPNERSIVSEFILDEVCDNVTRTQNYDIIRLRRGAQRFEINQLFIERHSFVISSPSYVDKTPALFESTKVRHLNIQTRIARQISQLDSNVLST